MTWALLSYINLHRGDLNFMNCKCGLDYLSEFVCIIHVCRTHTTGKKGKFPNSM